LAHREAWLITPEKEQLDRIGIRAFGTSAFVYDPYVLLRSFDVFYELTEVSLPGDIRTLVNETYCERDESGEYLVAKSQLKVKAEKLNSKALSGVSKDGSVHQDETAQTRLSDTPTSEVLLCASVTMRDGRLLQMTTVHGFELDLSKDWARQARSDINAVALRIKESVVSVPEFVVAPDYSWEGTKALKRFVYIPESETLSARFVIGVVDGAGKVSPVSGLPTSYQCTYSDNTGFAYERHGG
jgi:CRISPR-associated endonuclease/helicase Cas3